MNWEKRYTFKVQRLEGELARQLNKKRLQGIHNINGELIYIDDKVYFAKVLDENSRAVNGCLGESLAGLLEYDIKQFILRNSETATQEFTLTSSMPVDALDKD